MNKLRIFVDLAAPADAFDLLREGTRGHELIFPAKPVASILSKADPDPQFATADVAFGQPDLQAIADSGRLRWIHISSSGITRYDTADFRAQMAQRKIPVSNSAMVFQEACAVHCLSFMLAQARRLPLALRSHPANDTPAWDALRDSCGTLRGESVLILGYGAIGRRLVELLRPFDMKITACRRKARGDEQVPVITLEQLPRALADGVKHIINILPDSAETRRFFNATRFAAIKPGAIFYNIGRGSTLDQEALLDALRAGRLDAAWLDVTDPEPLPNGHPLLSEPNCFITPHIAGGHTGETKTLIRHFLANLGHFTRGEPLLDRVM